MRNFIQSNLIILGIILMITTNLYAQNVDIIAHRGGANLAPENTIASFKKAIALEVDMIEIDIEQTIDSIVVVIHDTKVDRTSNGTGNVHELTYDYIKTLDAGSWFSSEYSDAKISTLEDVMGFIDGRTILLIEIKGGSETYPNIEKRTVELIQKMNAHNWTIVQSFNKKAIDRVKTLDNGIKTYYVMGSSFTKFYDELDSQKINFEGVVVNHKQLSKISVEKLKAKGLKVHTWTVNQPKQINKMIEMGVDGIITNSPDVVADLVRK